MCMALFALVRVGRHALKDIALARRARDRGGIWFAWTVFAPDSMPDAGPLMLLGFVVAWSAACRSASCWR